MGVPPFVTAYFQDKESIMLARCCMLVKICFKADYERGMREKIQK